jgi:glycosyltransferase involved in cell wall biosynthesis
MTAYNGEKYIGEQINSILKSSCRDVLLSIYDDGSTDGTVEILKKYENEYPERIFVHQNEVNLGVTMNFLQAVCHTTTDYVMFCDQDDVWKPDKIAVTLKRMRHMESQKGRETPIAVFTDAVVVDQELQVLKESFFESGHLNPKKTDLPHLLMENKLIGCTVMLNSALRRILQSRRLPKQVKFHDWWVALIAAGFGRIGYINEGTLYYRQHGNNVVGNTGFLSYIKDRITSLKKQKEALLMLQRQAEEFLSLYADLMDLQTLLILKVYSNLNKAGFFKKRYQLLHYGFLKTGLIRNIGLLLII